MTEQQRDDLLISIATSLNGLHERVDNVEEKLTERLDNVEERLDNIDKRLDNVDKRLDNVEERLDNVDKRIDGLDRRIVDIEDIMEEHTNDIKNKFEEVWDRRNEDIESTKRRLDEHEEEIRKLKMKAKLA